jgi:glycosyltransferase involved in cell wall biosynthesis
VAAHVPFFAMPLVYASSDALLVTSEVEGSPNCVKEALACGVPVVTVEVGDVTEMLAGLTNCRVVEADAGALAVALSAVFADGRGCPDGPARVQARYSLAAAAARFVGLFQSALGAARPSSPSQAGTSDRRIGTA